MSWRSLLPTRLRPCPEGWELSRAFSEGTPPELAIHLRRCERCTAQWVAMERTRDIASDLPVATIGEDARQRMLSSLLAGAGSSEGARFRRVHARRWTLTTLALGAAAVVVLVGARGRLGGLGVKGDASAVTIHAVGSAIFTRERPLPDELIRLDEGTLQLEVASLQPGQHLVIATADAQVEAEGGLFDVSASGHQLLAVRVWRGHTEVHGTSFHVGLKTGDQWTRAAASVPAEKDPAKVPTSASAAPAPSVTVAVAEPQRRPREREVEPSAPSRPLRARRHEPAATFAPPPTSTAREAAALPPSSPPRTASATSPPETLPATASTPQRATFERGWRLLRAGDPAGASAAFRDVESQSHGDAIAEDALFWRAVADARAGSSREARDTLASFVSRFPRSSRTGEASAMLGWMLLEAHDVPAARRAFERARLDPTDRVRASAESGLGRIEAQGSTSSP